MNIILAGATGFIGTALAELLHREGHALTLLTRIKKTLTLSGATTIVWQPGSSGDWRPALDDAMTTADGVINLAGESIAAGRWSEARKEKLRVSRIETTRALVDSIANARGVKFLLNASAVGYYGPRGDEIVTEGEPPGSDFLARLCRDWEAEALRAEGSGARVVLLRTGIVLGRNGGALAKMIPPFKFFLGGPLGSGRQWMPWIHLEDEIGLIEFLIRSNARGAVNATAPEPVKMKDFCATLGKALGRPSWAPVPAFVLRLAFGEMADVLLTGQRAVPAEAERRGYRFRYAALREALENIVRA